MASRSLGAGGRPLTIAIERGELRSYLKEELLVWLPTATALTNEDCPWRGVDRPCLEMSLLLALNRQAPLVGKGPLVEAKRKWRCAPAEEAFDPGRK
jgi:hypothetical protein